MARNAGPSAATDVVVTDPLPSGVAFVSAVPPQTAGPDPLIWRLAGLVVGEMRTFTVLARVETNVAAGTLLRNTASIGAATPDPNPTNNSDEAAVQTVAHASVTITKTASPDPAVAGQPLTYTITLHNGGPSTASRVDVKELLPQGLTLQQLIAGQGVCVGQICQLGDLPVSRTVVITAVTVVDPNLPPGTQLCNTAAAFSNTPRPGGATGPITTTLCVPVVTSADLVIAKLASAADIVAGELLTYTLVATNLGPSTAMSVSVTDTLPAEVAFISAQPAPDSGPNPLIWNLGALQVGQTRLVTVTVRVNSWVTQTFTNTAGIVSATGDPNPGNNSQPRPVQPAVRADLSLVKQAHGATAKAGGSLTYTLIVRNAGPSDAVNVQVTDTLPAEVRFDAATPTPSSGPNPLIWSLGVLPAGASQVITVNVTIGSWVTQTFTNTAVVGSTTPDPISDDNQGSAPVTPVVVADLAITKTAEPSPAMSGRLLTYTMIITNVGPADAVGVRVTDTLPGAVAFVQSTPAPVSGPDPLVWSLGMMPARTSQTIVLVVSVRPTATQTFSNTALVGSQTLDPDDSNNDDTVVSPVRFVDLQIAKSDGVSQVLHGQTLTYTLVITNAGNATATGVVVNDRVPTHTTFLAASAGGTLSGDTVIWPAFSLAPGAVATRTVTVRIASPLPESVTTIVNSATARDDGSNGTDPTPDDNTSTDVDQVAARVIVSKSDNVITVEPGDTVIYSLTFTNTGSVAATNVVITETVPATTTFALSGSTAGWSCADGSPPGTVCTFTIGSVPPGASGVITFGVKVDSLLPVTSDAFIFNAVQIGAGNQVDPPGPGTTDTITTPIGVPTGMVAVSFASIPGDDRITLRWSPASELGLRGFHLWRNVSGDRLTATRLTAQTISTLAAGPDGIYTFEDTTAEPGTRYAYWLQAFWAQGFSREYGPIFARIQRPGSFKLWLPMVAH